jgi:Ca2+/H+ antiporter
MVKSWTDLVHAMVVEELQNFSMVRGVCVLTGGRRRSEKQIFIFSCNEYTCTYLYTCT